jgi:adenylate kinase
MSLVKVIGKSGLVRDTNTNVIHNINTDEVNLARARKRNSIKTKEDLENLKIEVNHVRSELSDIKSLINQLLEKS